MITKAHLSGGPTCLSRYLSRRVEDLSANAVLMYSFNSRIGIGTYIPQLALIILRPQAHEGKLLLEWLNLFGLYWQLSHDLGSLLKFLGAVHFATSVVRPLCVLTMNGKPNASPNSMPISG
ncbi:uncharacterized protein TrAFT101_011682 [Trichoderma asperellum]|uniref:uncharacterized protein n=1 Tax=Trichoderma asperellum TaxID=101201 RepID=UPI00331DFB55|nr:hypothetical protein TrAFT101_011682 [Trichoderma asperellum]